MTVHRTSRNLLDRVFTAAGVLAIVAMAAFLLVILVPIFGRGAGAYVFRGTIEHRRMLLEKYDRGDRIKVESDLARAAEARKPVYEMIKLFEKQIEEEAADQRRKHRAALRDARKVLADLLGPEPDHPLPPILPRDQYGQTRWDRAQGKLHRLLYVEKWDYSGPGGWGRKMETPRAEEFRGTSLEPLFAYVEKNIARMMLPRLTFYGGFLTDASLDAHFFGGIWPEVLGTLYLTIGAMLFAVPMGVIAAIYLSEYAREGRIVALLRTCISTLAGVPSIVFGLFGLAFFINTIHVSHAKSVLAGSLSLALLVLPTVIRAAEEAIRAVPQTYREAALSLGAGKWHMVATVILPAALPGILTGTVISMGRAAGETAPIIFTAAVSVGLALKPWETLSQGTPALSWNIYNLSTEHSAVEEIRHVQFGMVATLVAVVLILNVAAIVIRARISKKLRV